MEGKPEYESGRIEIKMEKTYYTKDEVTGMVRDCALCALREAHQSCEELDEMSDSSAVAFCLYAGGVLNLEKRIEDELYGESAEGGSGD